MAVVRYKKPKPLGVCTVCKDFTDEHIRMNHRCIRSTPGRRCTGIYKSSLNVVFNECASCQASGKVGSLKCSECQGWGWVLHSMT